MNNIFNVNRFGLLLRRQWLDFGKIYLLSLIVLLGILIGFYAFNIPKAQDGLPPMDLNYVSLRFRYPIFGIVGFLFISIVASSYFSNLGQKPKAIIDLMTPASTFEKFLAGVFYTAILSIISYLIIFYIIDLTFCKYIDSSFSAFPYDASLTFMGKITHVHGVHAQLLNDEIGFNEYKFLLFMPILVTSVFLLGSVYFNRFHYIKTAVSLVISMAIIIYIISISVQKMSENMIQVNNSENNEKIAFTIIFISSLVLTLFFWVVTYVRLKEKEV